jgi:hypothetical protein
LSVPNTPHASIAQTWSDHTSRRSRSTTRNASDCSQAKRWAPASIAWSRASDASAAGAGEDHGQRRIEPVACSGAQIERVSQAGTGVEHHVIAIDEVRLAALDVAIGHGRDHRERHGVADDRSPQRAAHRDPGLVR